MTSMHLRFLIVEDHEFQRAVLARMLDGLGAQAVYTAGNGAEALLVLKDATRPVDIIISDLMMPDVDGLELLPLLAKSAKGVSLILCSTDEVSLVAGVEIAKWHGIPLLGALAKPIRDSHLVPLLELYRQRHSGTEKD